MPRTHGLPADSADQPKSKRQKLTNSQLERKRELDREAQRTIRERTKNHIAHLEALVEQLQGDQGSQVQRLVAQLNESRAEVNRLRDALSNITKISASVLNTHQEHDESPQETHVKQETSPCSSSEIVTWKKRSSVSCASTLSNGVSHHAREQEIEQVAPPNVSSRHEEPYSFVPPMRKPSHYQDDLHQPPEQPNEIETSAETSCEQDSVEEVETVQHDASATTSTSSSQLSVSQMAASILSDHKLEGRYWYLAGVLLTEILKKQRLDGFVNCTNDEDIAVRAIIEGWSSVLERYPLDRGWQWLKELDETIYFHTFGPAERLMNLRNCRYQFLHQCYPDAGWDKRLPNFYAARRPEQQDVEHDPLVEHFPWPGFRNRLVLSPLLFATNKFMEALRRDLHFVWNHEPGALYRQNPYTGMYKYSDLFTEHIMDIKCYTARPEFFDKFPELGQDIPRNRCIQPSPLSLISHRFSIGSNSTSSTTRPSPIADDDAEDHRATTNHDDNNNFSHPLPPTPTYVHDPSWYSGGTAGVQDPIAFPGCFGGNVGRKMSGVYTGRHDSTLGSR